MCASALPNRPVITPGRGGRPPLYCSNACRQRAYRQRSAKTTGTSQGDGTGDLPAALDSREPVDYALSDTEHRRPAVRAQALTNHEYHVAALTTEGLTNQQIANRLYVSARTVSTHLERIRVKVGIRSRSALAAWFARENHHSPNSALRMIDLRRRP